MTTAAPVVDALGTYCPVPVRLLARALAAAPPGTEVLLLADDPLVDVDLPAYCADHGHALVAVERRGEERRALVRRGPGPVDARPGVS